MKNKNIYWYKKFKIVKSSSGFNIYYDNKLIKENFKTLAGAKTCITRIIKTSDYNNFLLKIRNYYRGQLWKE